MSSSVALNSMISLAVAISLVYPVVGKAHGSALVTAGFPLAVPLADARSAAPPENVTAASAIADANAPTRMVRSRCIKASFLVWPWSSPDLARMAMRGR
jgi:hypothetical protein